MAAEWAIRVRGTDAPGHPGDAERLLDAFLVALRDAGVTVEVAVFDRAWCPGAAIPTDFHPRRPRSGGQSFTATTTAAPTRG